MYNWYIVMYSYCMSTQPLKSMQRNKAVAVCHKCNAIKRTSDVVFIGIQPVPQLNYHLALFNCLICHTSISRKIPGHRDYFIVKKFDRRDVGRAA